VRQTWPDASTCPSFKSKLRQAQAKQKRAIDDYNRQVRARNRKVKRAVDDYNRAAQRYNTTVRSNRQRLERELSRMRSSGSSAGLTSIRTSSTRLHRSYTRVEVTARTTQESDYRDRFVALSEQEAANSLAVLNALDGMENEDEAHELEDTVITGELEDLSPDLDQRWRGALFALSPSNPDAGRHFCTSAREVFTRVLDLIAPDQDVVREDPSCDRTREGRPTRRARIKALLRRQGLSSEEFEEFVDSDVANILELFQVVNDGTHGSAGRYQLDYLRAVKKRVEDGILFLTNLAA
jgi:hypothetical protein